MSLDSVDNSFGATLQNQSPSREELTHKTTLLLKTLYVPQNLEALTTYLPKGNYETIDEKTH